VFLLIGAIPSELLYSIYRILHFLDRNSYYKRAVTPIRLSADLLVFSIKRSPSLKS